MHKKLFVAIDLGAGQGTRSALFDEHLDLLDQVVLDRSDYGTTYEAYLGALVRSIKSLLVHQGTDTHHIAGLGIASAGIHDHDGTFLLAANIPFLKGRNLAADLQSLTGIRARIANDADAGALGEWSVMRREMLYWVFGGGWGGAWVSKDGDIQYPAIGWKGRDSALHPSNEPGYSIGLDTATLQHLFAAQGGSFDHFSGILARDLGAMALTGPDGNPSQVRAETILSGPGRCRLFWSLAAGDDSWKAALGEAECAEIHDTSIGGKHISTLSRLRVDAAVRTDRLFGQILAQAARHILERAESEGLTPGAPICLGGKPAAALPWFGPSCQELLSAGGYANYLRPSVIAERGGNANLLGAAVLATKAASS